MYADKEKITLAMAAKCMHPKDLCKAANIHYQTYHRTMSGARVEPVTLGKIAKALGSQVETLIDRTKDGDKK